MIVLVLGGTRSGKSGAAESIAEPLGSAVTYVATAAVNPDDADHAARVAAHKARRPAHWATVECEEPEDLPRFLRDIDGVVLVDSLGTWVARHPDLGVEADGLLDALARRSDPAVVVSEEVGMSVHAPTELGRRFADVLGMLNQQVAAVADRVLLVVAGRVLELPGSDGVA
ncbi:MAG: bifunctional adenosylcobinamide kinase/adenosylcobinamide-phosphate guanylyltransferase [Acidimicrobiia bacterium]|nr:bifunctional adenosylcobinamide kinase/adenosylcobinamide-phosphate guanylyltransferase [Acidimicrobiia bacterium]MYB72614.1 bifunctional adenosylcobinamide kinase/adenosylcobinamide-phosphate guanylyltransferase [Acidimicrobiia bacterium]MYH99434.1 bifunctional adenosylcobinamide kinase/adenosylcobinamide-phosphate guanylyltransferase [Acidimicrobiia bacterium]